MKRTNKYLYGWKFYCHYGQCWEYEIFEDTYAGMKENRKAYRENSPYPLKIVRGRELNPHYQQVQAKGRVTVSGSKQTTLDCLATIPIAQAEKAIRASVKQD